MTQSTVKSALVACALCLLTTACAPTHAARWDEAYNSYRGAYNDGFNPERDAVKD